MKFDWTELLIDFFAGFAILIALSAVGVVGWPQYGIFALAVAWNWVGAIRGFNRGMKRSKAIIDDIAGVYK